jgi:anti-sigma B factor antagonist
MTTVELRNRKCGGYAVLMLRGELDTMDTPTTVRRAAAMTAAGQQLIIDLETLDFIDCHAVGALLGMREAARQAGGDVLLAAPRGPVLRLLTLLGVPGVFASVADAADSVVGELSGGGRPPSHGQGERRPRVLDTG